jgi:hypothetical protein
MGREPPTLAIDESLLSAIDCSKLARQLPANHGHRQGYFSRPEADIASQVFVGRDGGKRHSDPVSATDAYWE